MYDGEADLQQYGYIKSFGLNGMGICCVESQGQTQRAIVLENKGDPAQN